MRCWPTSTGYGISAYGWCRAGRATPNYAVGLQTSPDGANAPQLTLRLVEQLQLALSPYLARVLGLYFVGPLGGSISHL